MLLLLGFSGAFGSGLLAGHGVEWGDGYTGDSVDLEIAGPEDGPPVGALAPSAASPAQPPPPASVPEEPPAPEAVSTQAPAAEDPVAAPPPRPEPAPPTPRPRAESPSDGAGETEPTRPSPGRSADDVEGEPETTTAAAPGETTDGAGTGADDSTAGAQAGDPARLILGSAGILGDSVTARQALLPNGGVCDDPVVGTWRAQKYRAADRSWVRFILHVRRSGDEVSGTITSRIWTGRSSDPNPGRCTAFGLDHTWQMQARGRIAGTQMTFESTRARMTRADCPSGDARYAPDRFSGTVDALREVYSSRNNDGAFDIDEPYTFRRVSCE